MRTTHAALLAAATLTVAPVLADSPIPPSGSSWGILMSDYSGDGVVDAIDYAIWRESLGDFNRDGVVDAADYTVWRANFLSSAGTPVNAFNGDTKAKVLPLEFAWRGVPLRPMFPSPSSYSAWIAPLVGGVAVAGDYNGDGSVDVNDFAIWRGALASSTDSLPAFMFAAGDLDDSASVDGYDFLVWQSNFGAADAHNTPAGTLSGDFNSDDIVDAADYHVWRDTHGTTLPSGPTNAANDWWWAIDLTLADPCFADQNNDGAVNIDDIDTFVARFLAGDLAADANGDGALNLDDVDIFVLTFLAGCP